MTMEKVRDEMNRSVEEFKKISEKYFKGDHVGVTPKLAVDNIITIDLAFHGDDGMVQLSKMNKMVSELEKGFIIKDPIIYASYELHTDEYIQVLVFTFIVVRK